MTQLRSSVFDAHPGLAAYLDDRETLIALAFRVVESRAVAEEIVQEGWLRWQSRDYDPNNARPLFRRIVSNLAKDWYRREQVSQRALHASIPILSDPRDAERIVLARQELGRIVDVLSALPPRTRDAFRLTRVEGLTHAEAAQRLGTVPSRVHAHTVKALAQIAVALMPE